MTQDHLAIIPAKGIHESKTRLANYLSKEHRATIVKSLLHDVVEAVSQAHIFDEIIILSPDSSLTTALRFKNGVTFRKQTTLGLNRAVNEAINLATNLHAKSITVILGDIPLCKPQDFIEIFQIGGQENAKVVLAPSLKGGTNIMMLSPPNLITPSYGRWSYARHLRLAQKNNLNTYSVSNPRLSFDVDSPNDLRELLQRDIHGRTETSRNILQIGHMAPLPVKS